MLLICSETGQKDVYWTARDQQKDAATRSISGRQVRRDVADKWIMIYLVKLDYLLPYWQCYKALYRTRLNCLALCWFHIFPVCRYCATADYMEKTRTTECQQLCLDCFTRHCYTVTQYYKFYFHSTRVIVIWFRLVPSFCSALQFFCEYLLLLTNFTQHTA